ncbi:MAG: hypothetical protein IKD11_04460 [Oscillospiraceae bacterium]|nr:hypothetical protein [Oscillospiraceae bacterium]
MRTQLARDPPADGACDRQHDGPDHGADGAALLLFALVLHLWLPSPAFMADHTAA